MSTLFFLISKFRQTIILLLVPVFAFAQIEKINQLKIALKNHPQNDLVKVSLLEEISARYRSNQIDSSIAYAHKLLELSETIHHPVGKSRAYINLAIGEYIKANHAKAYEYNNKALFLNRKINYKIGEGNVLNNMAIMFHNEGKYDQAMQYYLKSLTIRKEVNDLKGIADSYNNIANLCTDRGNYSEALKMYFESLHIREQLKDTLAITNSYGNIAEAYTHLKKYNEAFHFSSTAYKLQKSMGNLEGMIQTSTSMGTAYLVQKNFKKAIEHLHEALKLAEQTNNSDDIGFVHTDLGKTYVMINQPDLAIKHFKQALKSITVMGDRQGMAICELGIGRSLILKNQINEGIIHLEKGFQIAQSIQTKIYIYEGAEHLSSAYAKINNSGKAYDFLKIQLLYKDSLFNEETIRKSKEVEFDYLLEKKQNEITLLEKDKSIQQGKHHFQQLLLIGLAFVVCLLALFIYFIHNFRLEETKAKNLIQEQKIEIESQKQNLELLHLYKDKTFSILSHDLRNPISTLTNFINLMDQEVLSEADFAEVRLNFRNQLKAINLLLENTLHWAKSQMAGELKPKYERTSVNELVHRNFDLFKQLADEKQIALICHIPENTNIWVDPDHLDIVLRNLILNAIKFTYINGSITVKSWSENDSICISVEDTGKGIATEDLTNLFTHRMKQGNFGTKGESGAGIGLILCKDFIERNNGTIRAESKEQVGSTFILQFPQLPTPLNS